MRVKFNNQEELVNFLKAQGFVFPNSEIYNGLANAWDYGPLGVLLKNNLKQIWWRDFITKDPTMVGLDSAIINNPLVWEASGHLANFSDPLTDCKNCKSRYRADKLIEEFNKEISISENTSNEALMDVLVQNQINCPNCKSFSWTPIRQFNLMFKTNQGIIEDAKNAVYLRPETAQGIFVNFKNIQRSMRLHLPFGVGQIGKAFRNEITPGNFVFRTREFEQMEIEYFTNPNQAPTVFEAFLEKINHWLVDKCGLNSNNLRLHEHPKEELSHYSSRTVDFQYKFLHGFAELYGLANRSDFDLKVHMDWSKKDLTYLDEATKTKYIPYVIEPSVGVERLWYAILSEAAYIEHISEDDKRYLLDLKYDLAPFKVCVLPLVNKLKEQAFWLYQRILELGISATFDSSGSIGKRYRRQDAIGTVYCITVDYDSEQTDNLSFTLRERNSMKQIRICFNELLSYTNQVAHETKWK